MIYGVTGASGWLGSRLVELLRERGHDVRTVDAGFPEGGTVMHLAGVIHPRRVSDFYDVNLGGTKTVMQAALERGVRRVVVMSSSSPCGCNPHSEHRFDEDSPYQPYGGYGRSKMAMEQHVRALSAPEWVLVRAPWFYGPNQPERQTTFFKMIRAGRFPLVGDGHNLRSMCYIDNLCEGLMLAAEAESAAGKIYWMADERPYSMNEIVGTVQAVLTEDFGLAVKANRLRLPWIVGEIATLADAALQRMGIYQQKIHVLSELNKNIACTIDRASAELGYSPKIELREGMRRSIAWCLSKGYLP